MKAKKIMAVAMATVMTLSMTTMAFADDTSGSVNGAGTFEGHVNKNVTSVTLPTATESTFAYKMDPEGLIAATEGSKYTGATFAEGASVYFQTTENNWTADSAKLKVVNKGTTDVDVTVTAKTAANEKVAMADSATFDSTDTAAKLYLGLKVADKTAVAVKTDDSGKVTVGLKGRPANYEIQENEGAYSYGIKSGVADTAWNSFEFGLTGACNTNGDYSAEGLAGSQVTVTWSYVAHPETGGADMLEENASTATDDYNMTAANGGYKYTFISTPSGSLTALNIDGTDRTGAATAGNATYASGVLTFNSTMTNNIGLATGNHTIKATIGETEYTLTITNS